MKKAVKIAGDKKGTLTAQMKKRIAHMKAEITKNWQGKERRHKQENSNPLPSVFSRL